VSQTAKPDRKTQPKRPVPRNPGYRFVRLPFAKRIVPSSTILKQSASGAVFSGKLCLSLEALTPLHIGDGTLRLSEEAGYEKGSVVKSILSAKSPIIPGSTIKGAARLYYEAITKSCLSQYTRRMRERYVASNTAASNVPARFVTEIVKAGGSQRGAIDVVLDAESYRRADRCPPVRKRSSRLCPACLLFGATGFASRVVFSDAKLQTPVVREEPLSISYQGSPQLHTVGTPSLERSPRGLYLRVENPRGRKLYCGQGRPDEPTRSKELWDYLPKGARFCSLLYFKDLAPAELGGLLTSLGVSEHFAISVGAGKALGLGKISVTIDKIITFPSGLIQRVSGQGFKEVEDIDGFVEDCKKAFAKSQFALPRALEFIRKICAH